MSQLVGTWKLISAEFRRANGEIIPLYGENPAGVLMYDASGNMSVQMMQRARPQFAIADRLGGTPEQIQAAFQGYQAYFGTYSIDENARVVTHHITGALLPNWVGVDQKRFYELSGNRLYLTLQTPTLMIGGTEATGYVVWKRANWLDYKQIPIETLIHEVIEKHRPNSPLDESSIAKLEIALGYQLPSDLREFYKHCNGAQVFDFVYSILPLEQVQRTGVYIFGEENANLAPQSWYAICDMMDGNYIGIDFDSLKRDGKTCSIIDCFHETHGMPGEDNIIALSFTEFLYRALNSEGNQYQFQTGFQSYGKALEKK